MKHRAILAMTAVCLVTAGTPVEAAKLPNGFDATCLILSIEPPDPNEPPEGQALRAELQSRAQIYFAGRIHARGEYVGQSLKSAKPKGSAQELAAFQWACSREFSEAMRDLVENAEDISANAEAFRRTK